MIEKGFRRETTAHQVKQLTFSIEASSAEIEPYIDNDYKPSVPVEGIGMIQRKGRDDTN